MTELLDARGVVVEPGDVVLYPYTYGQSACIAEGRVLGAHGPGDYDVPGEGGKVSLTASGRVRVRVVRRSYGGGGKPVVGAAPARLVGLKASHPLPDSDGHLTTLPPSPLPTQDAEARVKIEREMARSRIALDATRAPHWWIDEDREQALVDYHAFHAHKLKDDERKLRALDG